MQQALNPAAGAAYPLFARRSDRDYMVRSKKRPEPKRRSGGSGNGDGGRPPRRRRRKQLNTGYVFVTFLFLLLLYPIGLIMLWARQIPWKSITKLGLTLVFAMVTVALILGALAIPIENPTLKQWQTNGRTALANTGMRMSDAIDRAEITPARIWENTQDIAGNTVQITQNAIKKYVPVIANGPVTAGEKVKEAAVSAGAAISGGARELMYSVNLIPRPTPVDELSLDTTHELAVTDEPYVPTGDEGGEELPHITGEPDLLAEPDITDAPEPGAVDLVPPEDAEPTPTPTPVPPATLAPTSDDLVVWLSDDDNVYHLREDCPEINGTSEPSDMFTAITQGRKACADCAENLIATELTEAPTLKPAEVPELPVVTVAPSPAAEPTAELVVVDPIDVVEDDPAEAPVQSTRAKVTPMPRAAETEAPVPTIEPASGPLPPIAPVADIKVYYSNGGTYYHMQKDCGSMRDAPEHTLKEAVDAGKQPCPFNGCSARIVAPSALEEQDPVWVDADGAFHIKGDCAAISGNVSIRPLSDVLAGDANGCAICSANRYAEAGEAPIPDDPEAEIEG